MFSIPPVLKYMKAFVSVCQRPGRKTVFPTLRQQKLIRQVRFFTNKRKFPAREHTESVRPPLSRSSHIGLSVVLFWFDDDDDVDGVRVVNKKTGFEKNQQQQHSATDCFRSKPILFRRPPENKSGAKQNNGVRKKQVVEKTVWRGVERADREIV